MDEETKSAMESGKPVMIFHINSIGQMNPSATTVNNTYYGDQFVPVEDADGNITGTAKRNTTKGKGKSEPKASKPERKTTLPKLTQKPAPEKPRERMTFKKRGIQDAHLKLFFQKLIEFEWITKDNDEQDFLDLFSGELSDCKIIWGRDSADSPKYGKGTLVYLFRYLADVAGVISVPKNYSIPNILMGHFVDKDGNYLTDLDNGDKPNDKAGIEVLEFEKILKLNANRQGRRSKASDYLDDDFAGYGDELPSHLEDEGLSYSSKPY